MEVEAHSPAVTHTVSIRKVEDVSVGKVEKIGI
jgi:hypothetical protein